jgi:hypothetical protein
MGIGFAWGKAALKKTVASLSEYDMLQSRGLKKYGIVIHSAFVLLLFVG